MTDISLSSRLRAFMRANEHGMTVAGLAESVKAAQDSVRRSLKLMPDTYISEWVLNVDNGRFTSVWKIVTPPANAPEPDENHPRFKPCNPNWMTDLRKNNSYALKKPKPAKQVKEQQPVERKQHHPNYTPQKTVWVPVKPWPKGERP